MLSRSFGALIGSILRLATALLVPGAGPRVALSLGLEKGYAPSKIANKIFKSPRYGIQTAIVSVLLLPGIGPKLLGIVWGIVVYAANSFTRQSYLDEASSY